MSRGARRHLLRGSLCGGFLGLACASAASAQSTPAVSAALDVVNRASADITDVRLASKVMSSWGSNLLAAPVAPGQQRRVMPERQEGCLYSIRVVYRDNRFERFGVIDLCRNSEYLFAAKIAQPIANQATYNAPPASEVGITNRSSKTINVIRMSPAGDRMWGPDRLGKQTLAPGQPINVPLNDNRGCLYRLYAFYEDNVVEPIASANLCDDSNIVFRRTTVLNELPANMRLERTNAIIVANQSGFEVHWIYVYSRNERAAARDRLRNNEILHPGDSKRIDVSDLSTCAVTAVAVYRDRREESQSVDLCAVHEPSVTMRNPASAPNPQGGAQGVPSRP
ncbi:MAG: hypothetical protein K2X43_13810 [Hyphomonadaceae bacterium]|nr:hypothetical protein [Hyphomonadaceae bacterium]